MRIGFNGLQDTDIFRMGRETTSVALQNRDIPLYAFKKQHSLRLLLRRLCDDLPVSSWETFSIIESVLKY